ncbi:MAG: lipid-A-disaccharide synthase N-terminal domain-containing protein [Candidatus Aureabacteria bacterium]|nr:lipid-A-disaccharide synthase N-terminal domain-containing protein [Candidatus Auribacterota bacterium]
MFELNGWIILGLVAQFLFFMRFFIQWIASERKGKSIIPIGFWYLSISGGLLLLVYAIHIKDPIFILGQSMGSFIYGRNLYLIYKNRKNDMTLAT